MQTGLIFKLYLVGYLENLQPTNVMVWQKITNSDLLSYHDIATCLNELVSSASYLCYATPAP